MEYVSGLVLDKGSLDSVAVRHVAYEQVYFDVGSSRHIDSTVNGIPIIPFDPDTVAELFEFYKCDTLVFLSTQLVYGKSHEQHHGECHHSDYEDVPEAKVEEACHKRLSVIEDTYKLVLLVLTASGILAATSLLTYFVAGFFYFSFWNIFIILAINERIIPEFASALMIFFFIVYVKLYGLMS